MAKKEKKTSKIVSEKIKKFSPFQRITIALAILAILIPSVIALIPYLIPTQSNEVQNPPQIIEIIPYDPSIALTQISEIPQNERGLFGNINSVNFNDIENTRINIYFINRDELETSITEIRLVGFSKGNEWYGVENISLSYWDYFEIKKLILNPELPISLKPLETENLSVYLDLKKFKVNDPPITEQTPYAEENNPSAIFSYYHPSLDPKQNEYYCGPRFNSFFFLITVLKANGTKTISFMPIAISCEYLNNFEIEDNVINILDENHIFIKY